VIRSQDGPQTLFYCDPPYLHSTRTARNVYAKEMTATEHSALLLALRRCTGKVMLSGYRSELYDKQLAGWTRHEFELPNNAANGQSKRRMTECLWCNFEPEQPELPWSEDQPQPTASQAGKPGRTKTARTTPAKE
jgi:DNA adenine methylase